MRAVKGSLGHSLQDRYEKSEGHLLVSVLISQPDRLIFGLRSVYRDCAEPDKLHRRDRPERHSDAAGTRSRRRTVSDRARAILRGGPWRDRFVHGRGEQQDAGHAQGANRVRQDPIRPAYGLPAWSSPDHGGLPLITNILLFGGAVSAQGPRDGLGRWAVDARREAWRDRLFGRSRRGAEGHDGHHPSPERRSPLPAD